MKSTLTLLLPLATSALSLSIPAMFKRQAAKPTFGTGDADILNYALTLEHLEDTFYRQGLANFSADAFAAAGYDATFYANLQKIAADEKAHVDFLTKGLKAAGATPVQECVYNFPYTDIASFLGLSSILEGVGVSAYLGAAAAIASPDYLTAAGSILTVEARHSSYVRSKLSPPEIPFPSPFDTPLDFNEVYSLAAPFIVSCPASNPALPLKAFPALTAKPASGAVAGTAITPGSTLVLSTPGSVLVSADANGQGKLYAAFAAVTGPVFVPVAVGADGTLTTTVPAGFAGQVYVVLTACKERVTDETTIAGPAIVEVS